MVQQARWSQTYVVMVYASQYYSIVDGPQAYSYEHGQSVKSATSVSYSVGLPELHRICNAAAYAIASQI